MAAELEWMVGQLDEPLADPAPLNVYHISRLARDNGIKVMLSGAGGDDLFTGYRRHAAVRYERFWDWLPHSARVRLRNATAGLRQDRPALRRLSKLFAVADFDGDERLAAYFAWVRESELYSLYTPRVRAQVTEAAAQPMLDFLRPMPSRAPLDRMLALEQRFFLADHNLLYTDKMSMAAGVEVRVPYLDADLVEHAAKIPLAMKQRGRVGKWVLKKAMEPYLPRSVIYRPKTGFGAPLRRWLRNDLRHVVDDTLSADALNRRGVFDPAGVRRLLELDRQGRIDASYTIFSLVGIELWCRRFIDANRATALAPAAAASSS
jgi:asparagine synthase (glutamine-hydrolysing)